MAWNIPDQATAYIPPVKPEVPIADNTAAKIISEGTGPILQGLIASARMRQESELQNQKLAYETASDAQKFALEREKLAQDFKLGQMHNELMSNYYRNMSVAVANKATNALSKQIEDNKATLDYQNTIQENDSRASQAMDDLKLRDAKFQTDHPVQWLSNYDEFKNRFGTAVVGDVPKQIRALGVQADMLKVPFAQGAEFGPDSKNPKQSVWTQGHTVDMPLQQIAQMWKDPTQRDYVKNGLEAAGHGKIVDQITKTPGRLWGTNETKTQVPQLDEFGQKILNDAQSTAFGRGKPEVPTILQTGKPTQRMIKATSDENQSIQDQSNAINNAEPLPTDSGGAPEPTVFPDTSSAAPAGPQPTNTDVTLGQARAVIAANPSARDEVLRRLQSRGIDPNLLSAA